MATLVKIPDQFKVSFLIFFFSLITGLASAQESFPFLGQATTEGVNVRAGQSANFEKVGQLKAGEPVVVMEKAFSWYKIRLPQSAKAYITAKYIKEWDEKTGEVMADRVNVRAGNSEQASITGQAAKGQFVRILEKLEGWYKIEPIPETYGWVSEEYVKYHSKEVPAAQLVQAPIKNIYEKKRLGEEEASAQAALKTEPAPAPALQLAPNQMVFASGVVEGLAEKSIARDIRYLINADNNTSYYLKGPQEIVDAFLQRKVTVEGMAKNEITAPHPVIQIKKINLVL